MPRTNHCSLIAILLRSMAACFFRCFGIGNTDRRHLVSSSDSTLPAPAPTETVVSRNQKLSALFESQEKEDPVAKEKDSHVPGAAGSDIDDWQLKEEAKFLKACGTLQQTPDEIRKLPKKLKDCVEQESELKYHSWLPNISASKLVNKDELSGQHPAPIRFDEENTAETAAAIDSPTPSSCIINEQSDVPSPLEDGLADTAKTPTNLQANGKPDATNMSISPEPATACKSEFLTKSVRFANQPFLSETSPRTCIQNREKPELNVPGSMVKRSPYPTPLNVTVDMQTPGTVFASRTNARVRSQYVYTSMNVSETLDQSSISEGAAFGSPQNASCNSEPRLRGNSIKGDLTLSSWMNQSALERGSSERKYKHGGNWEDRPIIGLVAEHWKEEEDDSRISPKEWDGNGIPNTTTKYKEDQKVKWHATPFEERLEKALSDESFVPRRKPANMEAVVFEDDEETDTATCKLQSLKPLKPLASY